MDSLDYLGASRSSAASSPSRTSTAALVSPISSLWGLGSKRGGRSDALERGVRMRRNDRAGGTATLASLR